MAVAIFLLFIIGFALILIADRHGLQVRFKLLAGGVCAVNVGAQSLGDHIIGACSDPGFLLFQYRAGQFRTVTQGSGQDLPHGHVRHGAGFNVNSLIIGLQVNGLSCKELLLCEYAVPCNQ